MAEERPKRAGFKTVRVTNDAHQHVLFIKWGVKHFTFCWMCCTKGGEGSPTCGPTSF